jgi:MFS family permease
VLCLNVTAGIAVISMASPMFQEIVGATLVGAAPAAALTAAQKAAIVAAAAGLVGLISLFNSVGRIFWAALSDRIGRKNMYYSIFVIGIIVYSLLPTWGHLGLPAVFVVSICIILSMYGGGFATVPAYLADIFGPQMVGAIHGRLITAWSAAGVIGPFLIANLRQFQIAHGVPHARVYDITLYIMAVLLFCGLICNAFVKPVHDKHLMTDEEVARERALLKEDRVSADAEAAARGGLGIEGVLAWAAVGIPFFIGLYIAIEKAANLF